jgi:hypothetical protein
VLDIGNPAPAMHDVLSHERRHREAMPQKNGPVSYLYPPDKGWVRLDPGQSLDSVSLVDLVVLVEDPADIATMLLRLTDDEIPGVDTRQTALERKFSDVTLLFSALDPRLAQVMFGRLARAVLKLDPDRRNNLLQRTVLPGLLDGRDEGKVLRDFPDMDLAESICLLLDLETGRTRSPLRGAQSARSHTRSPRRHRAAHRRASARATRRRAARSVVGHRPPRAGTDSR